VSDTDTGIVPGSLVGRILDHMRVAGGEFEAGELAEALQVDLGEVRKAAGALRKLCKVIVRIEEGTPLYRLPEMQGTRIPGSAWRPLGAKARERAEPEPEADADADGEPPTETKPETPMPKTKHTAETEKALTRDDVLGALRESSHDPTAREIAEKLHADPGRVSTALSKAMTLGLVKRLGDARPFRFTLAGEKAKPEKPATKSKPVQLPPVESTAGTDVKPGDALVLRTPVSGAVLAAPAATGDEGFDFAISSDRMLAIKPRDGGEAVKMAAPDIEGLIDFLTRTQHVWRPQA
jgi:hypothetical protein